MGLLIPPGVGIVRGPCVLHPLFRRRMVGVGQHWRCASETAADCFILGIERRLLAGSAVKVSNEFAARRAVAKSGDLGVDDHCTISNACEASRAALGHDRDMVATNPAHSGVEPLTRWRGSRAPR